MRIGPLRIVATVFVTLAIMAVAVIAGQWQFSRYEARAEAQGQYESAAAAPTVALDQVTSPGGQSWEFGVTWRTVTVTGEYAPETLTMLRNRPVDGTAAEHLLAWFVTDEGHAVAVNAGWVAATPAADDAPASLPTGPVQVRLVLRDWEEDDGRRDAGATRITPAQLDPAPTEAYPGYGMVRHDCEPGPDCGVPVATHEVPVPRLGIGPHLSYAWQWWVFAALAPVGAVILLRRDAQVHDSDEAPPDAHRPAAPTRPGRQLSDEEIEDALPAP